MIQAPDDNREEERLLPPAPDAVKDDGGCKSRCCRFFTVEPVMLLYFMAFIPTLPLTQQFVYYQIGQQHNLTDDNNHTCGNNQNNSDPQYALEQKVQYLTSNWLIFNDVVCLIPAFLITMFLGPYSDKVGRKIAIILPIVGGILRTASALVVTFANLPIWLIFIGSFLDGCTGSIAAILMATFSYIADISSSKQRALRILLLELALGIGTIVSQIAYGYVINILGFRYPYLMIMVTYLFNLVYVVFVLRETVEKQTGAKLLQLENIKTVFRLFTVGTGTRRRWKLIVALVILFMVCWIELGSMEILTLYMLDSPLCFTSILIGYYSSLNYAVKSPVSILFLKSFINVLGETGLILLSTISGLGYNLYVGFARTTLMMFLAPLVGMISTLSIPMVRTVMSKLVKPEEQGTVFASIAMCQQLSIFLGALAWNSIYANTLHIYNGFTFFVMAGGYAVVFFVALGLHIGIKKEGIPETRLQDVADYEVKT